MMVTCSALDMTWLNEQRRRAQRVARQSHLDPNRLKVAEAQIRSRKTTDRPTGRDAQAFRNRRLGKVRR
jgi:hypothetical protein